MRARLGKQIIYYGAIAAVIGGVISSAWAFGKYTRLGPALLKDHDAIEEKIVVLANSYLHVRFQQLMDKLKQNGFLTFEEQQELCRLARELQYIGVPGCG